MKQKKLILIIEDEEDILELLEYTLQKEDFDTIGYLNIDNRLFQLLDEEEIDLILMDRNLPHSDGINFIDTIKRKGYTLPIIYVTAKDKEEDILEGFNYHADDYITKPFNINELCARVKAVLKRTSKDIERFKVKEIIYTPSSKRFSVNDTPLPLTQLEHDLLLEFITNQNILLSREHLLEKVWQDSFDKKLKTVNVAITRLKTKLEPYIKEDYIKSIRGEGYMFC